MEKKLDFGGNVVTINGRAKSFKRMFNLIDCSDEDVYYTKKVYKHEEEGLNFDYRYVVRVENLYELTGDDDYKGKVGIGLYIVPTTESFCKESLEKVLTCSGLTDTSDLNVCDIISYGYGITMGYETIKNCRYIDGTKVKDKLVAIANLLETFDSMRGFFLDCVWNKLGTTGWDVLKEIIHGKDYIESSFERLDA